MHWVSIATIGCVNSPKYRGTPPDPQPTSLAATWRRCLIFTLGTLRPQAAAASHQPDQTAEGAAAKIRVAVKVTYRSRPANWSGATWIWISLVEASTFASRGSIAAAWTTT